jgi:hypothetical protein
VTLLLGDNNKLTFYMGLLEALIGWLSYGREDLQRMKKEEVLCIQLQR